MITIEVLSIFIACLITISTFINIVKYKKRVYSSDEMNIKKGNFIGLMTSVIVSAIFIFLAFLFNLYNFT